MAGTPIESLHPNKTTQSHINYLITASVMCFASTLLVLLRFIQRYKLVARRTFWWDDWVILAALICAYGNFASGILTKWTGYHSGQYSVEELNTFAKDTLAGETLYNASITLSKASVLFFYSRIFSPDRKALILLRVVGFLLFGFCMAAIFGLIFADHPVQAQWNILEPHTSIKNKSFWIAMASINIGLDVTILAIPQAKVRQLQMSRKRKILLQGVFLLGGFVIIASIVRIIYLCTIDLSDVTYTINLPAIWTNVEMNMSIVCACLPAVYGLFKFPSLHFDGAQLRHKLSMGSSIRKIFGNRSNSSYTDIERLSGNTNHVYMASIHAPGKSSKESHDAIPMGKVHVQNDFAVE